MLSAVKSARVTNYYKGESFIAGWYNKLRSGFNKMSNRKYRESHPTEYHRLLRFEHRLLECILAHNSCYSFHLVRARFFIFVIIFTKPKQLLHCFAFLLFLRSFFLFTFLVFNLFDITVLVTCVYAFVKCIRLFRLI